MNRPSPWLATLTVLAGLWACNAPTLPTGAAPNPPWPRPANTTEMVRAAGLRVLPTEHLNYHIHTRLRVYHQGVEVAVPANIGIQPGEGLSPLHTHDATGLVHIESETKEDFTVGQFFTQWGIPLTGARALLEGKPVSGPVDAIVFADRTTLVVHYGPAPNPVPSTFDTPAPAAAK